MNRVQAITGFLCTFILATNVLIAIGQEPYDLKSKNQLVIPDLKAGQGSEEDASRVMVSSSLIEGSKDSRISASSAGYQMRMVFNPSGGIGFDPTCPGSEFVYKGKVYMWGQLFESDANYPLTFKLDRDRGFVYLCGRGIVTLENGNKIKLGYGQKVEDWLSLLKDTDKLKRQGAAQAVGWLAQMPEEKAKTIPLLIVLLNDTVMEVRRDSAEALGKIGDISTRKALDTALKDNNEWVRKVADESLALVDIRSGPKLEILLDKLKHESILVRSSAAEEIGRLKDKRALSALQAALQKEEDNEVKKTMEETAQKLQK